MQTLKRGIVAQDGFEFSQTTRKQVRLVLRLHLPFRLHFPAIGRFRCDWGAPCEVCFKNTVSIGNEVNILELVERLNFNPRPLHSDALVIVETVRLTDETLLELQTLKDRPQPQDGPRRYDDYHEEQRLSRNALNQSIIAYSTGTRMLVGSGEYYTLTEGEFLQAVNLQLFLLCSEDYVLTDSELDELFSYVLPGPGVVAAKIVTLPGNLRDRVDIDITKIQRMLSRQESLIFYEFAFESRSFMLRGQTRIALLMAVIALESVHGAFLRITLENKLPHDDTKKEDLVGNVLREAGIHSLLQFSCHAFLDKSQRPSEEELEACLQGITIRNAVTHGLLKKGQPKLRNYDEDQLRQAYHGIMGVYNCFLKAIESRLE